MNSWICWLMLSMSVLPNSFGAWDEHPVATRASTAAATSECGRTTHPPFTEAENVSRRRGSEHPALASLSLLPRLACPLHRCLLGDLSDGDVPPRLVPWYATRGIDGHVDHRRAIPSLCRFERRLQRRAIGGAMHVRTQRFGVRRQIHRQRPSC